MKFFTKARTHYFHMKSGNVIVLDKVVDFEIVYVGNLITKMFGWKQSKRAINKLFLASLDLSQIEAITSSKQYYILWSVK